MTAATKDLLKRALELPRKERGVLVRELIASLDFDGEEEDPEEVERAWLKVVKRRLRDLDAGRTKTIPGERVLAELRAAQARDDRKRQRARTKGA